MLLATDLDGTFLAGRPEHRHTLYQLINGNRDIQLVFVTGRGLEAVMPLLSDPAIPSPDYIICDVGGTVVDGCLQPVQPLQAEIDARWPGEYVVSSAMRDFPELERQEVPQRRRCSYYCHADALTRNVAERATELGGDLLYSADRYLDILPAGVNKGSTLAALVEHLDIEHDCVLVAGDTANDLAMFDVGFRGVCVGESEPRLLEATRSQAHVLHSDLPGCGGILQSILHFNLLSRHQVQSIPDGAAAGASDLVMVYHRLPYEEQRIDGHLVRRRPKSPNGIIPTLLSFFTGNRRGSWVAWSIHEPGDPPFEVHTTVDAEAAPGLIAARVPLSRNEVDIFYKRFSKEAFWPILNTFWERTVFREDDWQVFLAVNRKFAEATAAEAAPGATVWLHDYNLWMVPASLRELRPDVKIAFYHHTYFPSADIFNVLPWRRQIIGSLLQCDYIGFHIPRQSENFVDAAAGVAPLHVVERRACSPRFLSYGCAVGLETMTTKIAVHGRQIGLGAHPVGLDLKRIEQSLAARQTPARRAAIRAEFEDHTLALSVERLDYSKGTLEKIHAFGELLALRPELHKKISLVVVCVPAAKEMTIYDELQVQIEQAVGHVNGRFNDVGWTPIRFFFRPLPFEEVVAWYAEADVMWVTPLRDGLNLVCKEYVATQGQCGGNGVLVLSEFAGAAAELHDAVLTNPHDPVDLRDKLNLAITMDAAERQARLRTLYEVVSHHDIDRWGAEFLEAVAAMGNT